MLKQCLYQFKQLNSWLQFYLLLFPVLLLSDYLRFLTHEAQRLPAWLVFGTTFVLWMLLRRWKTETGSSISLYSHIDLLFGTLLFFLTLLRTPMPDYFWDTLSYHVSHQLIFFRDQLHFDFFSGGFLSTFFFPLGDSYFAIFRELLGYRLGTIGNVFVLIVSYYSVKQLLHVISIRFAWHARASVIAAFAAAALLSEYILMNIATYSVDLLGLPVFLAVLILFFGEKRPYEILLVSWLALLVVLKLVNLYLVVPCGLYYLHDSWQQRRFAWKELLVGAACGIFLFFPYLLFPYLQTGNPVFPIFNHWFGSPYFAKLNWSDTRWGPKTLIDFITWPVKLLTNNKASEQLVYYGRLSWGYLLALFTWCIALVQIWRSHSPRTKIVFFFSSAFIFLTWLWQAMAIGYIRYALILEVLAVVLLFIVYQFYNQEPLSPMARSISRKKNRLLLLFLPLALQVSMSLSGIAIDGLGWSKTYSLASLVKFKNTRRGYYQDIRRIGRDHVAKTAALLPAIDCWISFNETSFLQTMLAHKVPNIRPVRIKEIKWATPQTKELYRTRIEALRGREVYVATSSSKLPFVYEKLHQSGFIPVKRQVFASPLLQSGENLSTAQAHAEPRNETGSDKMKTAILIPCLNEEKTIAKVVTDFKRVLPMAQIYVYDNNSSDRTAAVAAAAGAICGKEPQRGKGHQVRRMFREVDADMYLLVDGDDTYPAEAASEMLLAISSGEADMVIGDRISSGAYRQQNKRPFHNLGNQLVKVLINRLFKSNVHDVMSGMRGFSRRFVKNCVVNSVGFEIETELTLQALDKRFSIQEIPIAYRDRPQEAIPSSTRCLMEHA